MMGTLVDIGLTVAILGMFAQNWLLRRQMTVFIAALKEAGPVLAQFDASVDKAQQVVAGAARANRAAAAGSRPAPREDLAERFYDIVHGEGVR